MMINLNYNTNSQNIGFNGALKKNLRIGEEVLKEFKTTYPIIKSNTKIWTDIEDLQHRGLGDSNLFKSLEGLIIKYSKGVKKLRDFKFAYNDITIMKRMVQKDPYANCQECADIIQDNLYRNKRINATNISMHIHNEEISPRRPETSCHVFTVLGMKKGAEPDDPKTWGSSAVVIDGWKNFVMKADDAINYFRHIFNVNDKYEDVFFKENTYRK